MGLGDGKIVINSRAHMIGPLVPKTTAGGVGQLSMEGTMRLQNLQFEPEYSTEPSIPCNFEQLQRHGWIRLTRADDSTYTLYICTENGWKTIEGTTAGRRRMRQHTGLHLLADLEHLAELFHRGHLSELEFDSAKSLLLSEFSPHSY